MLLWVLILSLWGVAVALFSRGIPDHMSALVLAVMGIIGVGFLAFMLFTSNPFVRILPFTVKWRGPKPSVSSTNALHGVCWIIRSLRIRNGVTYLGRT